MSDTVSIIPDSDSLYYRIHKADCVNGEIVPGAFKPRNGAMSTDWSAMSTVEKCRSRATNVEKNGVVSFKVLEVRKIEPLEVNHSPSANNPSHTDVRHPDFPHSFPIPIRLRLKQASKWEIQISEDK